MNTLLLFTGRVGMTFDRPADLRHRWWRLGARRVPATSVRPSTTATTTKTGPASTIDCGSQIQLSRQTGRSRRSTTMSTLVTITPRFSTHSSLIPIASTRTSTSPRCGSTTASAAVRSSRATDGGRFKWKPREPRARARGSFGSKPRPTSGYARGRPCYAFSDGCKYRIKSIDLQFAPSVADRSQPCGWIRVSFPHRDKLQSGLGKGHIMKKILGGFVVSALLAASSRGSRSPARMPVKAPPPVRDRHCVRTGPAATSAVASAAPGARNRVRDPHFRFSSCASRPRPRYRWFRRRRSGRLQS